MTDSPPHVQAWLAGAEERRTQPVRPDDPDEIRARLASASAGYTDAEVVELADVLAAARLRGVFAGHYTLARILLDAGYRKVAS